MGDGSKARLLGMAEGKRLAWIAVSIAFVLGIPSLFAGFYLDDRLHTLVLEQGAFPGGPRGIWDLYRFADGGQGLHIAMRKGFFPWFTSPDLHIVFFRPLASIWVAADHAVWGAHAFFPHLESCLLYAALVLVVARLYGRLIGGAAAGLATLLFAIDGGHSLPLLWIAHRYALLSALLSFGALTLHVRAREKDQTPWASVVLFALSLLAGETSIATFGYFLAYAMWADSRGKRRAVLSLWPYGFAILVWAIPYRLLGYGGAGSGLYVDPSASPVRFAICVVTRAPMLVLGQILGPPPEIWGFAPPSAQLGIAIGTGVVSVVVLAVVMQTARGHRMTRMLAFGSLLAVIPVCATQPNSRLLLVPGLGLIGLLGIAFAEVWSASRDASIGGAKRWLFRLVALFHWFFAPLLLAFGGFGFAGSIGSVVDHGEASMPHDEAVAGKTLILLSAPDPLSTNYMFVETALGPAPRPKEGFFLTVQNSGSAKVVRTSEDTIEIANPVGENGGPLTPLFRDKPFAVGESTDTEAFRAEVLSLAPNGDPAAIRFTFHEPLDAERWLVWGGHGFVEVPVLLVGSSLVLASHSPFE